MSHLSLNKMAPSTILTHVSAIGYFHRINDIIDPMSSGLVKAAFKGLMKNNTPDQRLPITFPILLAILQSAPQILADTYLVTLFQAMAILGFIACLRLSEMAAPTQDFNHTLLPQNVLLGKDFITIHFASYKHAHHAPTITFRNSPIVLMAMSYLAQYLRMRPSNPRYFFVMPDGAPVPRTWLTKYLKAALQIGGYPVDKYSAHSLRLGGATHAMQSGMTVLQVQKLGRWSSTAFYKYIRPYIIRVGQ